MLSSYAVHTRTRPTLGRSPWALLGAAACGGPAPCEDWSEPQEAGYLANAEIAEASGLIASRVHAETLFVHNDNGDSARLFALGTDGADLGVIQLVDDDGDPREADDFEDMAAGPGPDGAPWLYLGDIGDNQLERAQLVVHAFPEPDALGDQDVETTALALRYPDAPHNAETLLFDSRDNRLLVLTKEPSGETRIYSADAHASAAQELVLEGSLSFGQGDLSGDPELTGGDISADGNTIVLRTTADVFAWTRSSGQSLAEALAETPCLAPTPAEAQGESIALSDGDYYTVGEGVGATLWRVEGS